MIKEWCDRAGLDTSGNGDCGEAIRKEMISTIVENVKQLKHALTVEELIDAPNEGIVVNPLSDGEAKFMNEMADAVEQTTCTCTSLLNGHSNDCKLAPK